MAEGINELVALMVQRADDADAQRTCCERLPDLLADVDGEICATLVESLHAAMTTHAGDADVQHAALRALGSLAGWGAHKPTLLEFELSRERRRRMSRERGKKQKLGLWLKLLKVQIEKRR